MENSASHILTYNSKWSSYHLDNPINTLIKLEAGNGYGIKKYL